MLTWWPLLASLVPGATNAASDVAACASTNGGCFRTVQQCVDAVLSAPCDDGQDGTACDAGGRCDLRPGVYHEEIVVRPRQGRGRRGLTIAGSSSGGSVLTGAETLRSLHWVQHSGSIYRTLLPEHLRGRHDLQQLWVHGELAFEARWPNANLTSVVTQASWGSTTNSSAPTNSSHRGWLTDGAMARANTSFAGALLTLNAGTRVWTWTRRVESHVADTLTYTGQLVPERGGPSGLEMLYFVSGTLPLLDHENEWFIDVNTSTLYLWAPGGSAPADGSVSIKTHDLCVDSHAPAAHLEALEFRGCTFALRQCDGCGARNISLEYPSYSREVSFRNVPSPDTVAAVPTVTLVLGNRSRIENLRLRYSNIAGLVLIGSGHTVREVLISDVDWLGSLDFPAIQIGFAEMNCRYGHHFNVSTFDPSVCGHDLQQQQLQQEELLGIRTNMTRDTYSAGVDSTTASTARQQGMLHTRSTAAHPLGQDNVITRVTIRRYGGGGIVTSQLSNEVSFSHLSEGQLIGLDQAGIHADNLDAHFSALCGGVNNCSKHWHHNWVHDQREKGIRGDDGTLNTSIHHNVVFNCGGKPQATMMTARASGCGIMIKGDWNDISANTIFNVCTRHMIWDGFFCI